MKPNLFLYALVAALGGFLFGFDTAVINGALPFFSEYFQLDETMKGWAVSSAIIGCIIGAIAIGRPGDKYGRRQMLKVMGILFLLSAIGSGLANNIYTFIVFRIIGGLAVGGASVLSPMYISEIAPAKFRGRLTITFQLAIVIGILVAFASDLAMIDVGENNWRWMFLAEGIPAAAFYFLLFFVGRSPRWLVKNGHYEEAKRVIDKVNPNANSDQLVQEISQSIDSKVVDHFKYLFKKPYLRLVIIGIFIGMFNQFTGISVVMIYSSEIFRAANFPTDSAILQTVLVGFTNLAFTLIALSLIDKIGRKLMLLIGSVGMTVFLGLFGWLFMGEIYGYMPLIFMICFVAFFAFSQGAVVWVLFSEMFPNNIRARGSSIGSFSHWIFYSLITFLFPIIKESFINEKGIGYIFIFFAIMTAISYFFFQKYIVETKGKTLEQVEKDII